ncbi:phosphoprotein phosphatase [Novymonas esmeraldas]|uniref:Phosphoprotein phosphatase n=1 Tax=Novymonas esmeraldas TaxID=1808958 RepID=A0AAW0ERA2_9TRYP
MEKALQLVISHQTRDVGGNVELAKRVPILRPACVETPAINTSLRAAPAKTEAGGSAIHANNGNNSFGIDASLNVSCVAKHSGGAYSTEVSHHHHHQPTPPPSSSARVTVPVPAAYSSNKADTCGGAALPRFSAAPVPAENSPSVLSVGINRRPRPSTATGAAVSPAGVSAVTAVPRHADAASTWATPNCLLKALENSAEAPSPLLHPLENTHRSCGTGTPLGVSESSGCSVTSTDDDAEKSKALASGGDTAKEPPRFFRATPRTGEFVPLVEWLLRRGERGDVGAASASPAPTDAGARTQASFYNEDYIAKLCAAATATLAREPSLLELEVLAHDTLVVVGDIHGQFQDLYASVLCQQYDRQRCNPDGRDRRFLFMGDYVDRGPNSLEVVLLLLALKVEYPALVYLTRGNHEEEKTSRVYGFLTEATASLGAEVGAAVWSAVNKVFLDLPLAAVVHTPRVRFLVMHGGLSPALQRVEQIAAIDRHAYNTGELSKEAHDIVDGLLWSDPCVGAGCYAASSRGCGWNFGPAASQAFCTKNNFDFICRAHQLAMDGYFWMHNDRVVTVFSAPNYCGINDNRGAVMVVSGAANKPSFEQYEYYEEEEEEDYACPNPHFPYASYFY